MAQAFVVPHFSSSGVASELFTNTPWRALSFGSCFRGPVGNTYFHYFSAHRSTILMNSIPALVAVFLGGGIGASLRYGSTKGLLALGMMESRLHWATFIINIMASVALVYVYKLTPEKSTIQLFLATGICGGWSTFSTFSYETVRLIQQGREWEALAYVLSSVAVAFAAIWLLVK